jgi:pimeloyl-ACP methyl ester carboxylesterase
MPFSIINRNPECKLYYELFGASNAPIKVLFVMGLNTSHKGWVRQIDYFSSQPDVECCSFDNRGVHRSSAPPGPYTTELMARDALLLADDIGWQSFHLVGVSMGGMISQHIGILAPQRVLSLSLIATRAVGGLVYH